jgi:chemotaxis signal transduction protein
MSADSATCLNLLLFSVGGVSFGIEADQAESIAAYTAEALSDLFWFHDVVDYGYDTINYLSPTIITVKTGDFFTRRVIIDAMEDIAEFSLNDIRPFPPLIEPFALRKGMWGILARNGNMVLLVDFKRLTIEQTEGI